ncbi:T9SS type A sorting domain-containing protein [Pontibacter sp. G13]|uniref:T9SS type A sorting domain-containing protein n=1 Tax=Pontibacter sp. G13 TaxID=3074898 RepID=UPI0028896B62|nr:T9SS type A sorting domain-containing protein [Pontibacter sp. G13]WNJ16660.1 T9SS type A sorting domain-containing protein [Pontibacter sp. G13]
MNYLFRFIPFPSLPFPSLPFPSLPFPSLPKTRLCLVILWIMGSWSGTAYAQTDSIKPITYPSEAECGYYLGLMEAKDQSFYHITDTIDQFFRGYDSIPRKVAKTYGRWRDFWGKRAAADGNLQQANNHLLNILSSKSPADRDAYLCDQDPSDWLQVDRNNATNKMSAGILNCVYSPPGDENTIYVGSNTGGLWKTTDMGISWQNMTDVIGLPGLGVLSIVGHPDPDSSDILFIATGNGSEFNANFGAGVFRTTDGGSSWDPTALSWQEDDSLHNFLLYNKEVKKLLMHPTNPDIMYAMTRTAVYKTTDGWRTDALTNKIFETSPVLRFCSKAVLPHLGDIDMLTGRPDSVYVSLQYNSICGIPAIYRLADGVPDREVTPPNSNSRIYLMATSPAAPNTLWAAFRDWQSGGGKDFNGDLPVDNLIYKSNDFGATWIQVSFNPSIYQPLGDISNKEIWRSSFLSIMRPVFEVNPADTMIMYFGANTLLRTTNGGLTLRQVSDYGSQVTHGDIRGMQIYQGVSGGNGDRVLIAHDGGVSRRIAWTDFSAYYSQWNNLNGHDLQINQHFDIAASSSHPSFVLGGAQDNGTQVIFDSVKSHHIGGDGGQTIIDWQDSNIWLARSNSSILRYPSIEKLFSWSAKTYPGPDGEFEPYPFELDPSDHNILFAARTNKFYKFEFSGDSFFNQNTTREIIPIDGSISKFPVDLEVAPLSPTETMILISYEVGSNKSRSLFRSMDSGQTWENISPSNGSTYLFGSQINTIEVDPDHPNRVWVGLADKGKVWYSEDYGDTWSLFGPGHYSHGSGAPRNGRTPPLPVQSLIYQRGSDDVIYLANDLGVYRYNKASDEWDCFHSTLPPMIVSDLEIDYCQGLLYAGSFGRSTWATPLQPIGPDTIEAAHPYPGSGTYLTDTLYAHEVVNYANDIVVPSGTQWVIQGTLNMGIGKQIHVMPNARLIVDGGTITNLCGDYWGGIKVQGAKDSTQFPYDWPLYQGYVEARNQAEISYARDAISTHFPKPNGWPDWSGGIIRAYDSHFHNNWRSVEFMKYDELNQSVFSNCTFEVDSLFRTPADTTQSSPFNTHITMWGVERVRIRGCRFSDSRPMAVYDLNFSSGIRTSDASFEVGIACADPTVTPGNTCPANDVIRSSFEGFSHGIKSSGSGTHRTVQISNTDFFGNVFGVELSAVDNASVTRSIFEIGGNGQSGLPLYQEGIFLDVSSDFEIEENILNRINSTSGLVSGIRVSNGGFDDNQIYNNSLTGLDRGLIGEGRNRELLNGFSGLVFLCNTLSSMEENAIRVIPDNTNPNPNKQGIRWLQGNPTGDPAGNEFISTSGSLSHIANFSEKIAYIHAPGYPYRPEYIDTSKVTRNQVETVATCPDRQPSDIVLERFLHPNLTNGQWHTAYDAAESAYGNVLYNYHQLIDGGDTPSLLAQIQQGWSQDAWGLRNMLMAESPYLSQSVLEEVALSGDLPDAMLLEVCLANPEATKSESFVVFLETEIPNPLPTYMGDLIRANWTSTSPRGILEQELMTHLSELTWLGNQFIRDAKMDPAVGVDSVRYWLERRGTFEDHYALVETYISTEAYDSAQTVLDSILVRFTGTLEDDQLVTVHAAYSQLVSWHHQREVAGIPLTNLSGEQISALRNIASLEGGRASTLAQNILCFFHGECVEHPQSEMEGGASARLSGPLPDPVELIRESYYQAHAFPNPGDGHITIEWSVVSIEGELELQVLDIQGRQVTTHSIGEKQGQWLIDSRDFPSGTYFHRLVDAQGEILASDKIVIIH